MTFDDYEAIDAVNWSTLKEAAKSMLHYKHAIDHRRNDTPRFGLGRALHTAILEPHRFAAEYAVYEGERRAGNAWKEFQAENAGRTILKADEMELVGGMASAVRRHPVARGYIEAAGAMKERMLTWRDPVGIDCKGRMDLVSTVVAEVKTTATIDERLFRALAARMGYFGQLAFYRRGIRALTKLTLPCVIIPVETDPPHDVGVFAIPEEALIAADEHITKLLSRVMECRASGVWPGRYPAEQSLPMPAWAVGQESNETMEAY